MRASDDHSVVLILLFFSQIPADGEVRYNIKLLSFEKGKESFELGSQGKLDRMR